MVGGKHSFKMSAPQLLRFGIDNVLKILNERTTYRITLDEVNRNTLASLFTPEVVIVSSSIMVSQLASLKRPLTNPISSPNWPSLRQSQLLHLLNSINRTVAKKKQPVHNLPGTKLDFLRNNRLKCCTISLF